MLVFHGTSLRSAKNIYKEGWNPPIKNWPQSKSEYCYGITPELSAWNFDDCFTQALRQGLKNCVELKLTIKPAVICLDINHKKWLPDQTLTTPYNMGSIQIMDKIIPQNIIGMYTIKGNLNKWKHLALLGGTENITLSQEQSTYSILPIRKINQPIPKRVIF